VDSHILDAFAVIAFLEGEPGASQVKALLQRAQRGEVELKLHQINLGEIIYSSWRKRGETHAYYTYGLVAQQPILIDTTMSEAFFFRVCGLKARYPISYADAFAAALALESGGTLVTGDPELKALEEGEGLSLMWLP
jgi:predicted nucleic acid-binding protein